MDSRMQAKRCIEPEVVEIADYMRKKGLDPDGAEAWLMSCSLRWFMGELGIGRNGAIARAIRRAFVNQAIFMLLDYDKMREKFAALKPDGEAGVSSDENQ